MAESEKPETLPEQIARLKKEHKEFIAIEEADGILTGEVAQVRLARQRHLDHLEKSAKKK